MGLDDKPANSSNTGLFEPGKSGNPNGRPKMPEELKLRIQGLAPKAIETLAEIMGDSNAKGSDRVKASEIILDRGFGKPVQSVESEINGNLNLVTSIGVPDFAKQEEK